MLAGLAILPYVVVLRQPFIADDYLQIALGRQFGPVSGWSALAGDVLYRARATSLVLTYWTERFFGFSPEPFYASAVLLHVLNTWLVYVLTRRFGMGQRMALCAAAFFAVYEGHQEAVMWYAALPELLVFTFSLGALILWSSWLAARRGRVLYYAGALLAFGLALISKESAVAVIPLLVVLAWGRRRAWPWVAPFAMLGLAYAWMTYSGRDAHQHFHDGTFSLAAPLWINVPNSLGALVWVWGLLSLATLVAWGRWRDSRTTLLALVWMVITLLPYSFIVYMPRVPSRHTYLASVGLAWVVAAGFLALRHRCQLSARWPIYAVATLLLVHNCGYILIKKRAQFLERAAPTEVLVEVARRASGPVSIHCYPYNYQVAQLALEMRLGKPPSSLIWRKTGGGFSPACIAAEGDGLAAGATATAEPAAAGGFD